MMQSRKMLLAFLLIAAACSTAQEAIPATRAIIKEATIIQTAVPLSPSSTPDLSPPAPTSTPFSIPTIIVSPKPTPFPTPTPLSVPTPEFANAEVQFNIVDQFGGQMQAIDVVDDKAYVGVGSRLQVIDVSDPHSPQLLGQSEAFPSLVQDVKIVNGYAYVALGQGGVRILDITDPATIKVVSEFAFTTRYGIFDLTVDENILYGAATSYGSGGRVYLYDVADASNPINLTAKALPAPSVQTETTLVVSDGYLYTTGQFHNNKSHDLNIFTFGDPLSPNLEGTVTLDGAYSYFTIVGNLLYVVSYVFEVHTLTVIDVTDPTQPLVVSELKIDEYLKPRGIAVVNDYAYVLADQYTGTSCGYTVHIFDVSDLSNLQEINRISQAICSPEFVTVGNQLYVAEPHQMRILDLSNPTEFVEISHYAVPLAAGQPTRIVATNSNAYVFEAINETLSIWGMDSPYNPSVLFSSMPLQGGGTFAVANDLLYVPGWVGHQNRFRVFSVVTPTQPKLIMDELNGVYTATGKAIGFIIAGTSLEIINSEGLPVAPAIGRDQEGFFNYTATQTNEYVYVGSVKSIPFEREQWQLEAYNATNPTMLELVSTTPIPGMIRAIAVKDNTVYVIWGEDYSSGRPDAILGQVIVFDVSAPDSPLIVGRLGLPQSITVSTMKDNYLYFGVYNVYDDSISGIYAINVST